MAQLEIKKMKQGMSYSCKEKTIILNVFKYFRIQFPEFCVTEIVRRTAKATGCSEKSIFQFRKEEASAEGFKAPSTTKIRRNININSRDIKYDYTVRQAIRTTIYDLKYKNIVPSLNTILKGVNANPSLPNFSLMTLRRLMFDMGFCYEKSGTKSVLVEKPIVKKENLPGKGAKKSQQNKQLAPNTNETINNTANIPTSVPETSNKVVMPLNMMPSNQPIQQLTQPPAPPQQGHRIYLPHHENHIIGPPIHHHNVPMMLNHRMPPPPQPPLHVGTPHNVNMQIPWMHPHHHAMMKQE